MDADEGFSLQDQTTREQEDLTNRVLEIYGPFVKMTEAERLKKMVLFRDEHEAYCLSGLRNLPVSMTALDAGRPWIVYWIVHSLSLLGRPASGDLAADIVGFLQRCQAPTGGFGGGPRQQAHLATTYAAVSALVTLGGPAAAACVDRQAMLSFLLSLKNPPQEGGGFRLTAEGETDTRGCYTALAAASMLGLLTPAVTEGVGDYLVACQTYEGGMGGEPGTEAHGGYTFCGFAAALLAGSAERLDLPRLLHWAVQRQGSLEGGFNGRTNKLVDGCYSFWQGGLLVLLKQNIHLVQAQMRPGRPLPPAAASAAAAAGRGPAAAAAAAKPAADSLFLFPPAGRGGAAGASSSGGGDSGGQGDSGTSGPLFNPNALQSWLLICCQSFTGGLRDKPGKRHDFYHTCYCLSGLSMAQHFGGAGILGGPGNAVERSNPLLNVAESCLEKWQAAVDWELRACVRAGGVVASNP